MFWECHIVASSVDKLLDQPVDTVKLQDFLDESDLIQECLTQNKRLLDYLIQPNIMTELIECIIKTPIDDNFRNACVVSELLSGDFQRIQEKLIERENFIHLYSFVLTDELNLNPILTSYFSRILTTLIIRKPNELLNSLKSCSTFKTDLLKHLYSTSIADIIYRLISDSADQRSEIIKWYEEINLIDGLIDAFIEAKSIYVQMNIVNLLTELIRLAFDQHNTFDNDLQENTNSNSNSSNPFSSNSNHENDDLEKNFTTLTLAQHILSKSNLEKFFDALCQQTILVAHGCDFLNNLLDLFHRHLPAPLNISLSHSNSDENQGMQVNDDDEPESTMKSNEINADHLANISNYAKDPFIAIYKIFLQVIPHRLPALISLLSNPSPPLIPSSPSHDNSQAIKYQFISEPLGIMRLNLIKFFSKLIHTISNDFTGDFIYEILESNHLLNILIDLFSNHIYNNFLHTQVYHIIRHLFFINVLAVKQANDIWTRLPLNNQSQSADLSTLTITNRCSYKLFESLLNSTQVNLIERLLDQYELNLVSNKTSSASDDALSSSLIQTRFSSPNSGHIVQILRCLREHAILFNNYTIFIQTNEQDETNSFALRWQTTIDHLNEDETKWSSMHHNERDHLNSFHISAAAANIMAQISSVLHSNDSSEASHRRQTFHMRSFGSSGVPYVDEDDDDVDRFNIDDELMNHERIANEQHDNDTKQDSFESQFPPVFDEQTFWPQRDGNSHMATNNNNNHADNYDKPKRTSASTSESHFEQLCSLRANEHDNDRVNNLFSSTSSNNRDELDDGPDEF